MSGKVYAISAGDYSDYHIVGVFSTPEKRAAFLAVYRNADSGADDEDFDLDPEPPETITLTDVWMHKDGMVGKVETKQWLTGFGFTNHAGFERYGGTDFREWLHYRVATDDHERAVKVTNEKRAQILAADAWGDHYKTKQALGLLPDVKSE